MNIVFISVEQMRDAIRATNERIEMAQRAEAIRKITEIAKRRNHERSQDRPASPEAMG